MEELFEVLHYLNITYEGVKGVKEGVQVANEQEEAERQFNDTSNDPGPLHDDLDPGTVIPYMQAQAEREKPDWCQPQDGPTDVNDLPDTDPVCPITPEDLPDAE